ncbi:MAG: hypothetical protein Q9176_001591 [Flavoplaca citrina]
MASDSPRGIIPPPAGVEANFVNPEYRSGGIVPIIAVFFTLSTVFLALRIYTKARIIKIFGLEDMQQKYGNGIHMWNITVPKFLVYQHRDENESQQWEQQKHSSSGGFGAKIKSWVGSGGGAGTRASDDTDSTFVSDGRDVELGKVGWTLESGRGKREVKSESEENIIERPPPTQRGIVKTVNVDVRRG